MHFSHLYFPCLSTLLRLSLLLLNQKVHKSNGSFPFRAEERVVWPVGNQCCGAILLFAVSSSFPSPCLSSTVHSMNNLSALDALHKEEVQKSYEFPESKILCCIRVTHRCNTHPLSTGVASLWASHLHKNTQLPQLSFAWANVQYSKDLRFSPNPNNDPRTRRHRLPETPSDARISRPRPGSKFPTPI